MRNYEEEIKLNNEENAEYMKRALDNFVGHPERIDNFVSYLSQHFSVWVQKYANTPDGIANEFLSFSQIN